MKQYRSRVESMVANLLLDLVALMCRVGHKSLCDGSVLIVLIWGSRLPPVGFANDRREVEASQCKGCDYAILYDDYVIAIPNTKLSFQ
jgi:hypothetical protein